MDDSLLHVIGIMIMDGLVIVHLMDMVKNGIIPVTSTLTITKNITKGCI